MNAASRFTAIVLAADRTGRDPVATAAGMACKAIVPIAGVPMVIRVLDALEDSGEVDAIILCGPPPSAIADCPELERRIGSGRVTWVPNLDSPSRSADSGLAQCDADTPVLLTTADHALLSPAIVRHFLHAARLAQTDAAVGVVRHEDVAAAFPGVGRTVIRLGDGGICGCNLYAFLNPRGRGLVAFWQQAEDLRKQPWRLIAQVFGLRMVLSYVLGRLTLGKALHRVSARTGIRVQPVFLPYPQAGIDVDKVEDMRLATSVLASTAPPADGDRQIRPAAKAENPPAEKR
ncbi:nucleotidyltransferase family protein [Nitrosovibrio sp. Nv17]|uniref:nucleotidyltransferase family protein n=1 Tax=Nitrosovibrio sp. Nv17 TaxID=1855339 RepID=UPI0009FB051C|nr:nucleotidyltransferase family protein [Nitrosovibrio sp. Nv17]